MSTEMPRKHVPPPLELVKDRIDEVLPPDAQERIAAGDVTVVDVRDPEKFAAAHIAGAVNIPVGEDAVDSHAPEFAERVAELAGGSDAGVVLYCGSGNKSARATDALVNEHGFSGASSLVGGVTLWRDLGYHVEENQEVG